MALRATRDTYALERTGPDTAVRRIVKAGQLVPEHFELDDASAVEDTETAVAPKAAGTEKKAVSDANRPEENEGEKRQASAAGRKGGK